MNNALVDELSDEVVAIETLAIYAVRLYDDAFSFNGADFARLKIEAENALPWTLADASDVFQFFCHSSYNKATAPRITGCAVV